MLASITTLKLHATSPATAGARTFEAVLLNAIGTAARRDSTGAHPPTLRGRGAVFPLVSDLAWWRAKPVDIAPRDFLTNPRAYATDDARRHPCSARGQRWRCIPAISVHDARALLHGALRWLHAPRRRGGGRRSPETGEVMRDRSRSYVLTLAAEEAEEQIARIESFIRRFFRQEAAFLELSDTRATVF